MRIRKYRNKSGVYKEELILNKEEQVKWYSSFLNKMQNPGFVRFVLDNFEKFPEYKVFWNYYASRNSKRRSTIGKPPLNSKGL